MVNTAPSPTILRCPRCGTPTVPLARFCFQCGRSLWSGPTAPDEAAERRVVTVLFADLSDFTAWAEDLDPERVGEVTDRVLAALAREIDDVGGRVDNLTGDGIMAVFGAPTTHEDDPERAVRAAAAMQSAVQRLVTDEGGGAGGDEGGDHPRRLGLRVGINSGEVFAGVQAAMSYTVIGDTVNTAARLSAAAAVGAVYAGRETAVASSPVATWRRLAPLRLKGKREPVDAFELVSLRPSNVARRGPGDKTPFTGRERELGVMTRDVRAVARRRSPATLVVTGEAGIGKTRISTELGRFAMTVPGARVLWGRAARYGDSVDLSPIADIARGVCGVEEGDDPARAVDRIRQTVARLAGPDGARVPPAVSDRLLTLLGLPGDAATRPDPPADPATRESFAEHTGDHSGDHAVETTVDAVAALVSALAASDPVLVILDDLEWAPPATWAAVRRFARSLTGAVLLVLLDREQPDVAGLPEPRVVQLTPLDEDVSARLLRETLGGARPAADTRAALLGRVRGNPFFLTELVRLLVDRGMLHRGGGEDDDWVLDHTLDEDALPAGVQAVLAARIDSLGPAAKATLRAAAVLGVRFPLEALIVVEGGPDDPGVPAAGSGGQPGLTDQPEGGAGHPGRGGATLGTPDGVGDPAASEITAILAGLAERQLVRPPARGEPLWSFVHPMARDVAYAGLPKAERARRHAAAARWAVRAMGGPPGEVDTFVGAQAERAAELAGSMALPPDDPAWSARAVGFRALIRRGQAAVARGDHRAADQLLARARQLGADAVNEPDDHDARILHAEALANLRRLPEAEATLLPALAATDPRARAAAYGVLGDIRHKQGRDDDADQALLIALDEAERVDERVQAATLRQLGMVKYGTGRLRAAEEHFNRALRLARRGNDDRGTGWALQHLAWSATTRGDYPAAATALREAAEVFTSLDDAGGLGWCAGTEGLVFVLSGQLTRAREVVGTLIPVAESTGERWALASCLTIDALAAAELGDVTAADAGAARAAAEFDATGDSWGCALSLVARGLAARGAGDPEQGARFLYDACVAASSGNHALVGALSLVLLGLTRLDGGHLDDAERIVDQALRALDRLDLEPHALLGARVLVAQVERARGRVGRAIDVLEEALDASEPATLLFPRRQAYAHLAGTLLDAGQPERALLIARQAVDVYTEDVRARVLAWRALGTALLANGDVSGARAASRQALDAATATGAIGEAPRTRRLLAALPAS
ncbi:MAG: tetratricopeptide repeat protein [Frankia sp.]